MAAFEQLVGALSDEATYGTGGPVDRRETHISIVFLAGEFAFKLRKPVDFGFLDFSTREARYIDCWREVTLNRRLAPDVYLGVVPVTSSGDGLQLGGSGRCLDWVVKMRRLHDSDTLQSRVHAASEEDVHRLLDVLCPFFRSSSTGPHVLEGGDPYVIRRNIEDNLEVIQMCAAEQRVPEADVARLRSAQLQFLAANARLFTERAVAGCVRDGHGDLRAEHVYLTDPVVIIDCIEFNDHLRHVDTLDEICFLAIDLERLGRPDLAQTLLHGYRQRMDDSAPRELEAFFKSYRCSVRAKVACLRADEETGDEQAAELEQAARHLAAANRNLEGVHQPWLFVVCGLSGTGKSTVAHTLAARIGAVWLSSDVVRKELHGFDPLDRGTGAELYTPDATRRTYEELCRRARNCLRQGVSVVLDATYQDRTHRQQVASAAQQSGAALLFVLCRCPEDVARIRIRERQRRQTDPSDAGIRVFEAQLRSFNPLDEVPASQQFTADTRLPIAGLVDQIVSGMPVV